MNTKKLSTMTLYDSGFVFDPATGHSFITNFIGIQILNILKEGRGIPEIKKKLLEDYDVSEHDIDRDLTDFIENVKNNNLV